MKKIGNLLFWVGLAGVVACMVYLMQKVGWINRPFTGAKIFHNHVIKKTLFWTLKFIWPAVSFLVVLLIGIWRTKSDKTGAVTCEIVGHDGFKERRIRWDRNSFCRGWLITGSTGSGKTECGINKLLHSVFQHEAGIIANPVEYRESLKTFEDGLFKEYQDQVGELYKKSAELKRKMDEAANVVNKLSGVIFSRISGDKNGVKKMEVDLESVMQFDPEYAAAVRKLDEVSAEFWKVQSEIQPLRERVGKQLKPLEKAKFKIKPWGGILIDEKGSYWATVEQVARTYRREHHLMLLQTRPEWAGSSWKPKARFNLISDLRVPAETYAKSITATYESLSGKGDSFFLPSAGDAIQKGIELMRALREAQIEKGVPAEKLCIPNLKTIDEILTGSKADFDRWLAKYDALDKEVVRSRINAVDQRAVKETSIVTADVSSAKLSVAVAYFKGEKYFSGPPDQIGGVKSTAHLCLSPFCSDDVAEVFCSDNSFDFSELDNGMLLCVAMPQKLRLSRRFICTILKELFYTHVLSRFDRAPGWKDSVNLLVLWQDEAQSFIIKKDGEVDKIREAQATTVISTQSIPSLWSPLGGKQDADPIILNLRNRLIFTSADTGCADANADFLAKEKRWEESYSVGQQPGSGSVSYKEDYKHKADPNELKNLKKFNAYVVHSDGFWKRMLLEPVTTAGSRPKWAFEAFLGSGQFLNYSSARIRMIVSKPLSVVSRNLALCMDKVGL